MLRRFLLPAVLAVPAVLFAQQVNQQMMQPGMTQTNPPAVVVVPSSPSIYIGGGFYGAYLTPLTTLPRQEIGISLAGREGISMQAPVQTGIYTALPSPYNFGAPIAFPGLVAAGSGHAAEAEPGRLINDLMPSYYIGETAPSATGPSLGEFSRAYKRSHPRAVRIFTNVDAEHLSNSVAVPGATPPSPQQDPPARTPQKENMKPDRRSEIPRSTASAAEPGRDLGRP